MSARVPRMFAVKRTLTSSEPGVTLIRSSGEAVTEYCPADRIICTVPPAANDRCTARPWAAISVGMANIVNAATMPIVDLRNM